MIDVVPFGSARVGPEQRLNDITAIDLTSPSLAVRFLTLGASIASVRSPDRDGRLGDVHLRLASATQYADTRLNPHLGGSIGRYANRIANARFPLDDRIVLLDANRGAHHLHGGADGFDRRIWTLVDATSAADGGSATLSLTSPDGDEGYPGRVTVTATFEVADRCLRIVYHGRSDAPTVLGMTNHGYWNLAGAGSIGDHRLVVAADLVVPVDADGIPSGAPRAVADTAFDLRTPARLGPVIDAVAPGLDHCYVVGGDSGSVRPAAVLDDPSTGRWLSVATDQPGLQVYTGNGLKPPFVRHGAVSLETQLLPDTPNRPEFGSAVLRPGGEYRSVTELCFGHGRPPSLHDVPTLADDEGSARD